MMKFPFPTLVLAFSMPLLAASCAGGKSSAPVAAPPPQTGATPGTVSAGNDPNSVPDIARREVIRRQEMIRQMDEAAIKASLRMAEDDLEGAVEGYRRAMGQ